MEMSHLGVHTTISQSLHANQSWVSALMCGSSQDCFSWRLPTWQSTFWYKCSGSSILSLTIDFVVVLCNSLQDNYKVILLCIFLMISDSDHLFIHLLVICMSVLKMMSVWRWKGASEVKSIYCSCRASVSSTHIQRLTSTCNSSSRGPKALFWPLQVLVHMYTYPHADTNMHLLKNK